MALCGYLNLTYVIDDDQLTKEPARETLVIRE